MLSHAPSILRLSNVHTKLVILHAWPCWAEGQQVDARNDGDLAARLGPSATRHILMPRRCEDTLVPDVLCHRATSRLVHDMVRHRLAALEASVLSQRLCLASSYLNRVECVGGQEVWPGLRFHPAAKT